MHFQLEPEIKQCWRKSTAPNGGALGGDLPVNTGPPPRHTSEWQTFSVSAGVIKRRSMAHLRPLSKSLALLVRQHEAFTISVNRRGVMACVSAAAWCWWTARRWRRIRCVRSSATHPCSRPLSTPGRTVSALQHNESRFMALAYQLTLVFTS